MFRELCGDSTLRNVILVTNMWGDVTKDIGESRERELTTNFFKQVIDKGAQLARHQNTTQSAHDIIRRIMKNRPVVLQIRRELVDEHKDVADNVAVEVANGSLTELVRHFQAEMKALQEKLLQSVNEKTRKKLEEETRRLQDQMVNMRSDSESMASIYLGVRRRMEEMMREMQEQARRRREQYGVRGRSLQSTPPILPPVSMANKKLQVHDTYYMDDRMIVLSVGAQLDFRRHRPILFQCGGVLFRIPRWHLDKYYPNLLLPGKPDGNNDGVQGTSDDTAIPIGDHISAEEFTIFLNFFYRRFASAPDS